MKTHKNTFFVLLAVFFLVSGLGWAQEGEGEALIAPEQKVEPVFPEENEALIFIEGEDAVSTNFTNEPILNYSCSKFRTLQLNRRNLRAVRRRPGGIRAVVRWHAPGTR